MKSFTQFIKESKIYESVVNDFPIMSQTQLLDVKW
jgi:hypothetical protein